MLELRDLHVNYGAISALHGITLAKILEQLVAHAGWEEMGRVIPVRCFTHDPSIRSSLTFLRKTAWARAKVEALYLDCLDEIDPASDKPNAESTITPNDPVAERQSNRRPPN